MSDKGRVRNNEREKIHKPLKQTCGYHVVQLVKDRKVHSRYIHRLVGAAFIPNPSGLPQIDHIDGCKSNNAVDNLRWVTVRENRLAYGYESRKENKKRLVKAVHLDGRQLVFNSRNDAAEHFKCSNTKIKYDHLYKKSSKKGWIFTRAS